MPEYRPYKSSPFHPEMSPYWFVDRWPYLKFTIRELSSVFVAWFAVMMLLQIHAISAGPGPYARFEAWMASPVIMGVNFLAFLFISFHAVTWFLLVPRVFVRHLMGNVIPDSMAAVPNYGAWVIASAIIALFALRII